MKNKDNKNINEKMIEEIFINCTQGFSHIRQHKVISDGNFRKEVFDQCEISRKSFDEITILEHTNFSGYKIILSSNNHIKIYFYDLCESITYQNGGYANKMSITKEENYIFQGKLNEIDKLNLVSQEYRNKVVEDINIILEKVLNKLKSYKKSYNKIMNHDPIGIDSGE